MDSSAHGSTSSPAQPPSTPAIDIFPFDSEDRDSSSRTNVEHTNASTYAPKLLKSSSSSTSQSTPQDSSRGNGDKRASPAGDQSSGVERVQRPRTNSTLAPASVNEKTPSRSFYHRSFHTLDTAHYSSPARRVTEELASRAASGYPGSGARNPSTGPGDTRPGNSTFDDAESISCATEEGQTHSDAIQEVSEPTSPIHDELIQSPSAQSSDVTKSTLGFPPEQSNKMHSTEPYLYDAADIGSLHSWEGTSLLNKSSNWSKNYGATERDVERQTKQDTQRKTTFHAAISRAQERCHSVAQVLSHPKTWNLNSIWRRGIVFPASLLPAVFLGLLLNLLDALSYGMILFPLGQSFFSDLAADGISIFFVSTIVSQLVYSCGGSIFRGGVGSEMIEVVPFFHQMAFTIMKNIGDNKESVLATTILAFSISSVITGAAFFLLGAFKIGALIGFFPRHILIGSIGGVGFFLFITGVEVSARLEGNLEYDTNTLHRLFQLDTVFLWVVPLVLASVLHVTKRFVKSKYLVGGYFVAVAALFYLFKLGLGLRMDTMRSSGWVFDASAAGSQPWYHFYTLFNFKATDWRVLASTAPAMLALTFFSLLHIPLNLPALSISTGEDNLNVDRELIAHGISNGLSGFLGSIQNYLVYSNSLLFIESGGDSRVAGIMLAAATFIIMIVGTKILGFVPVMVVGALIFLLGIELLEEALVDTWGKVSRLEYLTICVIILCMGIYDFVAGILIGIVLACLNFVVQTSRKSAIRAVYSGEFAGSTVRRHPTQAKFLKEAGQQTQVVKVAGYLFFGTIVALENKIRALLDDKAFKEKPLRFLIVDFWHVSGVDFSGAECLTKINRILRKKNVHLITSGLELEGDVGKSLQSVGLFVEANGVEVFQTLNEALEYAENNLLQTFYAHQELLVNRHSPELSPSHHLNVPRQHKGDQLSFFSPEVEYSTPRRNRLHRVAQDTLQDTEIANQSRWAMFDQPLPLMLHLFETLSEKNEDFWFRAKRFFKRQEFPSGTVLYERGDIATAFLLIERGSLRADYHLPQGRYSEIVLAGQPIGELPFFSETERTATVVAEEDAVLWRLGKEDFQKMSKEEPQVTTELLRVVLKLNKERMDSITKYILTTG